MIFLKQSTASQAVLLGPYIDDTDGKTAETGLTIANTDIRLSAAGGNMFAKTSGGGTHDEAGWYTITLDATDTAAIGSLQISSDVAGALPVFMECMVVEEDVFTWFFASGAAPDTQIAAIKTDTVAILDDTDLIDDGTSGLAKIATDVAAILVDTGTTIPATLEGLVLISKASVGATGNTTTVVHLATGTGSYSDNELNGFFLVLLDTGSGEWHVREITGFANTGDLATVATLPFTPATDDFYWLLSAQAGANLGAVDVGSFLGTAVAAATASGEINANVTELGGVVQSLTDLKDFADDGYDPATNKVTGVLLTDTVTTYTGNTLQTADVATAITDIGNLNDISTTQVNTEVDNSMVTYGLDHLISLAVADTDVADNSIIAEMVDAGATSDYTNYSKTEDSQRAISEKVSGIGAAAGGGFNFAAVGDDALTDVIINLDVAVDKSTSPATVGIPVTGHAFKAGHEVTIANTVAYNNTFVIDSVTTNEVVIVSAFTGETFGSDDTIVSSIKATSIEGVQTTNTFAATSGQDGVYHVIDDDGGNNFAISYRFEVGGGRLATEGVFTGFLNGGNDNAFIQAYDFVGDAWETRVQLTGQGGSVNQTVTIPLLAQNTGTSVTDIGVVFLRVTDDTASGSTNPTLNVDSFLVEAVGIGQTIGYENGQIWINTNASNTSTENFVDGTADNPVSTLAAAKTLSTALGIGDFHVINGSTITLAETSDNESYFGDNWTLALGTQQTTASHFEGAHVTGVQTGTGIGLHGGSIGTATLAGDAHLDEVALEAGTITLPGSASVAFSHCTHAASSLPILDFAAGTIVVHMHGYAGGIEIQNMDSADILHLDGNGRLDINANCTGAVINIRGAWDVNDSGSSTIVYDDTTTEVTAILADTGTDGVVLAANAITEAKIADNAIATEHIATGAISADSFAANAITAALVSPPHSSKFTLCRSGQLLAMITTKESVTPSHLSRSIECRPEKY